MMKLPNITIFKLLKQRLQHADSPRCHASLRLEEKRGALPNSAGAPYVSGKKTQRVERKKGAAYPSLQGLNEGVHAKGKKQDLH